MSEFFYFYFLFFRFGPILTRWIHAFYEDSKSCVWVNGQFTEWFKIQRGVRQRGPISQYLFLICAEVQRILIRSNNSIKEICIQDKEIKLSQFADDTNLTLDGSEDSFKHTINTLKLFADISDISGLKIFFDKTNAVWFGSLKFKWV